MATPTTIRDLRESKNLSQFQVRTAAGLTYSKFVRIENGSGKTTPEEVKAVMDVLKKMEPGTRKLAGRPFKDPAKQAAVLKARAEGGSVAAVIGAGTPPAKAPATKKTARPSETAPTKAAAKKKAPAAKSLAKSLSKSPKKVAASTS